MSAPYVELHVASNYSFLRGASQIEELLATAHAYGLDAIAITDWNTLAGIARAHARAAEIGIRLIVGCRIHPHDSQPLLIYPTDRSAYGRLCRLLTLGKARAGKGGCDLAWRDGVAHGEGLIVILLPAEPDDALATELARLAADFPGRGYVSLCLRRRPNDLSRLARFAAMGDAAGVPSVVTGDVLYHEPSRRILQDVVTCIREGCTIDAAGFRRERSVDRHLKPPAEFERLYAEHPDALARTREIADRCRFSLSELRYQYPDEGEGRREAPQQVLERLVRQAIPSRYPDGLPPDVDVDFESDRREEVIQWIFERYSRDRAALCATVMRFRSRGAVRDVGKVLGLPEDITSALAGQVWGHSEDGVQEEHAEALKLNLQDRRLRMTLQIARELIGFPRQLGTHPGGFVLVADRLDELVPVEPAAMADRQVIEWDKDDIDALKWMKVDVLGLGMLGCLRRSFEMLGDAKGLRIDMASIPPEDPATYAMIRKADTLGTFQIESRAQMTMLPRLRPTTFYDLVVQVAIVRPGPIQGDMVHPYLRRREGREPVHYPKPELRAVLGKTLGVPLFQEQAMQVAIHCAGFTPGEADQLRRAMATFKFTQGVTHFRDKLVEGMVERGYGREFAERTFSQLEGFGSYGFPESHAASFALVAYASSWIKCHHPDVFCAGLLNSQPMGFYAPAQIVRDAREHGVEIRPICVNTSRWDCSLERRWKDGRGLAVRMGLRMVRGLSNEHGAHLVARRGVFLFESIEELRRRTDLPSSALERLAEADAFHNLGVDRRQAQWAVAGLADTAMPLFAAADARRNRIVPELDEPMVELEPLHDGQNVVEDYRAAGLSLRQHPISFLRGELHAQRMIPCADLAYARDGRRVVVAGLVLVRQRPSSAKGVMFITIEDETGVANLVLWADRFQAQRSLVLSAGMIACHGRVQREGEVIHIVTEWLEDLSGMLRSVGERDDPFPLAHGRGDGATYPAGVGPRSAGIWVATRDFR